MPKLYARSLALLQPGFPACWSGEHDRADVALSPCSRAPPMTRTASFGERDDRQLMAVTSESASPRGDRHGERLGGLEELPPDSRRRSPRRGNSRAPIGDEARRIAETARRGSAWSPREGVGTSSGEADSTGADQEPSAIESVRLHRGSLLPAEDAPSLWLICLLRGGIHINGPTGSPREPKPDKACARP